jgi:uncharacterized UBP type Zn finger protein
LQFSGYLNLLVLSSSGNASIEAAINWVVEHENDSDIDQMPLVCFILVFCIFCSNNRLLSLDV